MFKIMFQSSVDQGEAGCRDEQQGFLDLLDNILHVSHISMLAV